MFETNGMEPQQKVMGGGGDGSVAPSYVQNFSKIVRNPWRAVIRNIVLSEWDNAFAALVRSDEFISTLVRIQPVLCKDRDDHIGPVDCVRNFPVRVLGKLLFASIAPDVVFSSFAEVLSNVVFLKD
jgi:hypothetical protein